MTQQLLVTAPLNSGLGTPLPTGGNYINSNFTELYSGTAYSLIYLQGWANANSHLFDNTGALDMAPTINAAIQYCFTNKLKLATGGGVFLCNSSLFCFQGSLSTVFIEGQGTTAAPTTNSSPPTPPVGTYVNNTVFYFPSLTLPSLIFNCNRGVVFSNIAFMGPNIAPSALTGSIPLATSSSYLSGGVRYTQYSPQCAIAIDPFTTSSGLPPDGGYPGLSSYYGTTPNNGSYGIEFNNCSFWFYAVGATIGCAGGPAALGADIQFNNCQMYYMDTFFAVGQGQTRLVRVNGGNYTYARQVVDTLAFGGGQGSPIRFKDVNFGFNYRLFSYNDAIDSASFEDCYGESIMGFGNWGVGGSTSRYPLIFRGGHYGFGIAGALRPPMELEAYGEVTFDNVGILDQISGTAEVWNLIAAGGARTSSSISIRGCQLSGSAIGPWLPHVGLAYDGISTNYVRCEDIDFVGGAFQHYSDNPGRTSGNTSYDINGYPGRAAVLWSAGRFPNGSGGVWSGGSPPSAPYLDYVPSTQLPAIGIGNCSTFVLTVASSSSGTVTFVCTTPQYLQSGAQTGDILYWQMLLQGASVLKQYVPALIITGISGNNITATMLREPAQYDSVVNQPFNNTVYVLPRRWAPSGGNSHAALTGNTHTNTTLDGLSSSTVLLNGDWISGTGFAANTRVVSGGGGASVVLNQATTATNSGVALYFDRFFAPTLAAVY